MYNYDPKSLKAEEFINHEEIEETLRYAEENKHNAELIDSILEKAKLRKGLSHREAEVLLDCDIPEKNEEIYKLAEQIKKDFYGNRIVMFAPLYLSNYCVNGCLYCPYHAKNKHICRKKLTQDEVRQEVIALQDMGHKRLAIEAGEDPVNNPLEYILECIKTIYSIKHKNGAIRRVNVNIAATTVEDYRSHLYNAMPPFSHRAPGVVGAACDSDHVRVELICDGVHLHPATVRTTFKMFGDDRICLISDSMMATGLSDGDYSLGGQPVKVVGNLATLADGTIAGSATNLMDCMRTAVKKMGIPLGSAVKCAAVNTAKAIGIYDTYGSITPGKKANIVLLDQDLNMKHLIFKGELQK